MSDVAPPVKAGLEIPKRITRGYASYVFFIMFSINLLNYFDRYVFIGASDIVGKELHFGIQDVGFLASAFLIVYTLGTLPLGIWADRAKRKNVVALCVTIWSLATAFTALANSYFTLFISRMILGIGEAGYFPAGTALMSDYFSRTKRARVMSWWSTGQYVGLMIGFVAGGIIAGLYFGAWRLAFIFTGIPGLILAFLAWRLREPRRNQADEEAAELEPYSFAREAQGATELDYQALVNEPERAETPYASHTVPTNVLQQFGTLLRIKTLVVLIAMQVFAFFVLGANVVYLPIYLQQKNTFGLTSGQAGTFSGAVIVLAGIIGIVIGGYMADRLNRRHPGARVLVCGIGFLLSAPSFVLAITLHNFIIFTMFFVLTVLLLSIYNGPSTAATQDVVPSALRASAVAISLLLAHLLGDAFAPALVGILAGAFDPTGTHFAKDLAGQDLSQALLFTCPPALVIAGLIGIFGARWMKDDIAAADRADILAKAAA